MTPTADLMKLVEKWRSMAQIHRNGRWPEEGSLADQLTVCANELQAALTASCDARVGWRVELLPVAVKGFDGASRVQVTIGVQTFRVGEEYWETREEADWYAGQLRHALSRALATPAQPKASEPQPASDSITPDELWTAIDGNPGIKPTKQEALDAAKCCSETADECYDLHKDFPQPARGEAVAWSVQSHCGGPAFIHADRECVAEYAERRNAKQDAGGVSPSFRYGKPRPLVYGDTPAAQPAEAVCTCPSGDGSLRWPCPQHPAQPAEAGKVRGLVEKWRAEAEETRRETSRFSDVGRTRVAWAEQLEDCADELEAALAEQARGGER